MNEQFSFVRFLAWMKGWQRCSRQKVQNNIYHEFLGFRSDKRGLPGKYCMLRSEVTITQTMTTMIHEFHGADTFLRS
jgi:hypothetical protein